MTGATPENEKKTPEDTSPVDSTAVEDVSHVPPAEPQPAEPQPAEPLPAEPLYDLVEVPPAVASAAPEAQPLAAPLAAPLHAPADGSWQAESAVAVAAAPVAENPAGQMQMQMIYVPSPAAPPKKGNRGIGIVIAIASTVIFAALYSGALALILSLNGAGIRFDFLGSVTFYIPVIFFLAGFVALVAVVNRGAWWTYVLGSLLVGLFVYFGTIATGLVLGNVLLETPAGAARLFTIALTNPFVIAAAFLSREVSMWTGALISARGRRIKAKNAETKADFDRETAERHAQYEQARYRAPQSAV